MTAIRLDDMANNDDCEVKAGGPTSCRGFFCESYASHKSHPNKRGQTNAELDERLRFIEEDLLGIYPNEDMKANDPKTWFKNERKILGYFPAIRIMILTGVIMTIWSCLDFAFAMCVRSGKVITVVGTIITGIYAIWALMYDRVVEVPPTYTYFHRRTEMYGWCGYAFLAPMWYAYTVVLVLIAIFSIIIALALSYVAWEDLIKWDCESIQSQISGAKAGAGRRLLEYLTSYE